MRMYLYLSCLIVVGLSFFTLGENQAKAQNQPNLPPPCRVQTAGAANTDCGGGGSGGGGSLPPQNTTWSNNGIISMSINEGGFPMISNLSVLGNGVMYFDNVGAGFQMDMRSSLGNAYNPTQAGDCVSEPSKLLALDTSWGGNGIGIPSNYGIQWRVQPRNYNQPGATCPGPGALLPYEFDFAATLGDGTHFPMEGMILNMTVTRLSGSQTLERGLSELPAFYPLTYYFSLAYWSPDGVNFYAYNAYGNTNNTNSWPLGANFGLSAKAIMLCGTFNGTCIALYSNQTVSMHFAHVHGARWNMTEIACDAVGSGFITDFSPHTAVRVLAVGNPQTIEAVIAAAKTHITDWGDL